MIILPLSQKTVRGSNMSQRPLSWSTKTKVQQRGIFSEKLVFTKHKLLEATQPSCRETGMLAFSYSISQCRMQRHSNQDWILGHFIYLDSKMGLCKTRLCVKDNKTSSVWFFQMWCSDRFTFRKVHGKQTWHPFSKEGNSNLTRVSLFLEKGLMDSQQ